MELPFGMRPSTLEERKAFYANFTIQRIRDWIQRDLVFAIILGRHSNIYKQQYKEDKNIPLIIDNYRTLYEVKQKIITYLPEGVYYDRNYYKDISKCHEYNLKQAWNWENFIGQQLAFDIDPENVDCPVHGTLKERMNRGMGLSFCEKAFDICKKNMITLYDELTDKYSDVRIVFSGRGFHVHVMDKKVITLTRMERKHIAEIYSEYGIDAWVTSGEMRLIRLPYTLNALSSRVVLPLNKDKIENFNPEKDALPRFLSD